MGSVIIGFIVRCPLYISNFRPLSSLFSSYSSVYVQDIDSVANSATSVPLIQIIVDSTQNYAGTCVLMTLFWITTFNALNVLLAEVYLMAFRVQ
jgi:hypothetical protein